MLFLGFRSSVAANSGRVYCGLSMLTLDMVSASGSCVQELPSILVCDAAMLAATLCRVKRGLPWWRLAPWYAFRMFLRRRVPLLVLPLVGPWTLIGSCWSPSLVAFAPVLRRGFLDLVWVCLWIVLCFPALLMVSGSRLISSCSP